MMITAQILLKSNQKSKENITKQIKKVKAFI